MNPHRRLTLAALLAAAFAPLSGALAQGQNRAPFTELSPPLPVESGGKIEVAEFFWYGCIHCFNLEPNIEAYQKRIPPDVSFRRIPAIFNQRMADDAAIYYAFESLGQLEKLHKPFFEAIHKGGLKTGDRSALADWLGKNGTDATKFFDVMKSFGVQSKVRRAAQQTVASKIDGTPAMLVNGRYAISAEQAGRDGLVKAAEIVVDLIRKQK
jgi:thiol:disulfide interchange protein DsbA